MTMKYKICLYVGQDYGECNPIMAPEYSQIGNMADYVVALVVGDEINLKTLAYICGAHFQAYESDILQGMKRGMELELAVEEAMNEVLRMTDDEMP